MNSSSSENTLFGFLNNVWNSFTYTIIVSSWLAGFVFCKSENIWYCICPFYSWYILVEKVMVLNGWF